MVEWRDRGFVQDSDDDEELNTLGSQSPGEAISPKEQNEVELQLQKELQDQVNVQRVDTLNSSRTEIRQGPSITLTPYQDTTLATRETPRIKPTRNYVCPSVQAVKDDYDELQNDPGYRVSTKKTSWAPEITPNLAYAQEIEDDILEHIDAFDVPSSPLSDPLCSPVLGATSPPGPNNLILSSPRAPFDVRTSSHIYQSGGASRATSNGPTEEVLGNAERNLRRRNPIQLHPYLLENEQYRNSLKSRGLRPVTVANESSQNGGSRDANQYQTELNAEESQSNALNNSSQSNSSSSPLPFASATTGLVPDVVSDEDDLPDLNSLFPRSLAGGLQRGYKRRKTTHFYSQQNVGSDFTEDRGVINPAARVGIKDVSNPSAVRPSSRASSTPPARLQKKRRFKKFRVPKGLSPAPLPTPVASSELGRTPLDFFQLVSESDSEGRQGHEAFLKTRHHFSGMEGEPRLTYWSSSSSVSEASLSDSEQIRQAQRRIKGVLPASWLKLDKQARISKRSSTTCLPVSGGLPSRVTPSRVTPQRGIARRVHAPVDRDSETRRSYTLLTEILEISDDSRSSPTPVMAGSPPTLHRRIPSMSRQHSDTSEVDDFYEAQEDNWVDYMPPTSKRHRKIAKSGRTRQLKLTDTFERSKNRAEGLVSGRNIRSTNNDKPSRKDKLSREKPHRTERARRKPVPRLSILDAPQSLSSKSDANFIKLASRQARSRLDKGRHSPYRKLISLHNRADTVEMDSVFRDWKSGKMVQSQQFRTAVPKTSQRRLPLAEQSLNVQTRFPPSFVRQVPTVQVTRLHGNFPSTGLIEHSGARDPKSLQSKLNAIPINKSKFEDLNNAGEIRDISRVATAQQNSARAAFVSRPGQLEDLEAEHDHQHKETLFQRTIIGLDSHFDQSSIYHQRVPNPLLTRFLEDDDQLTSPSAAQKHQTYRSPQAPPFENHKVVAHRQRKRAPQRIYTQDAQVHRLQSEESCADRALYPSSHNLQSPHTRTIFGLGAFGTRHTTDFGIKPLAVGTYFHQKTFIGSGELRDALELSARDLDVSVGSTNIICGDSAMRFGPWTEDVSTQLGVILTQVGKTIQPDLQTSESTQSLNFTPLPLDTVPSTLRSIIRYYSKSLSFLDSVDRLSCVDRSYYVAEKLFSTLMTAIKVTNAPQHSLEPKQRMILHILMYVAVFAHQILQIGCHSQIDSLRLAPTELLLRRIVQALVAQVLDRGLNQIRDTFVQLSHQTGREAGIREGGEATEVIVVLDQVLDCAPLKDVRLWNLFNDILSKRLPEKCNNVQIFEDQWQEIFTLLPLLEFDSSGILISGKRFKTSNESWAVVNTMLDQLFDLYACIGNSQAPSMNSYIRAILSRCHQLVHDWGWRKCEPILKSIFDFFARNHLYFLRNEAGQGSAKFLEHLRTDAFPGIEAGDRSFHIFLKILGAGLIGMRNVYPSKKIGHLAWRFIPAHGRVYKKEEEMRQEDLEALRNNHDVLCVLYSACPPLHRLNVDKIANLVDCATSHSEVCRLSVRSWANLVKFQLSTDESPTTIEPFALWYNQILRRSMAQHRFARIEAENFFHAKVDDNAHIISKELLESTVSNNQRQIEAVLSTALASMRNVIKGSRNSMSAIALVQRSCTAEVFNMFDSKQSRPNTVIEIALEVYQAYFALLNQKTWTATPQQASEDSQDYGEWPDLDEAIEGAGKAGPTLAVDEPIAGSIQHLLSNCFGTENFIDETLLARVVDTWVTVIWHLVVGGQRDWAYYLQHHSPGSWSQLRDTDQTRKFSTYFLASIMNCDRASYDKNISIFVSAWLVSLVERESMLKYQHTLTTSILNIDMENPLLQNLPFSRNPQSNRFDIDLAEFRDRRLGLISSVFSNMRQVVEDRFLASSEMAMQLRQEYNSLLKQVMSAMKWTYQEIQLSSSTRGAYVDFVQRVVEFLQQYTSDIRPVDKFFTESSAFPLPTADPAYVVGKLKGYGLKLADTGTQKKLAMFLQTVCERAAAETQQTYLIEQFKRSVEGIYEKGDETRPSLRRFFIEAIFPAYMDSALASDCGWIVALPVLEAATCMFDDLVFVTDLNETSSTDSTINMISIFLTSLRQASKSVINSLHEPQVLKLLATLFKTVTSTLSIIDYIQRSSHTATSAINLISYFEALANFLSTSLSPGSVDRATYFDFDASRLADTLPSAFTGIRAFCARELQESLAKNWVRHGSEYYVLRGSSRREVVVDVGTIEEEKAGVLAAIEEFNEVLGRMPAFGRGGVQGRVRVRGGLVDDDVFV